jgi:hypothetical protein
MLYMRQSLLAVLLVILSVAGVYSPAAARDLTARAEMRSGWRCLPMLASS